MKKSLSICLALLISIFFLGFANKIPIKTMPNVEQKLLDADYWINKTKHANKLLMSSQEIDSFNKQIIRNKHCLMNDLAALPGQFPKEALLSELSTQFPQKNTYLNGIEIDSNYRNWLEEQLNIKNIKEMNAVQYGISVRRTNLKMFPTSDIISYDPEDLAKDQFQNGSILVDEPLLILHSSLDSKWYYVYSYNCTGWVSASDVAVCKDRYEWLSAQQMKEFVVVTSDKLQLEVNPYNADISKLELTMGTKLPLVREAQLIKQIDGRALYDNYVVWVPVRANSGYLQYKMAMIPVSKDISIGYLPYTRANILKQAFKMEGNRYGWGGMLEARDCSLLVLELFRCFGFYLPRNSAAQPECPGTTYRFTGLSIDKRAKLLGYASPGAALYFPGHAMIYLGKSNGYYYVLSAVGSFGEFPDNETQSSIVVVRSIILNELTVRRLDGKQWIEALTSAKLFGK